MNQATKPSIVVILYPGALFFEIALALEFLAGRFQVIFATPDGCDHCASNGSIVRATAAYKEVDLSRCLAVLVPGGDPASIIDNADVDELVRVANMKGLWLGAICAGPLVLAKAGVLKGRKIAHGYGFKELEFLKSYFEGVELSDSALICDGKVITAKPDAHIDFAVEVACRLGAIDASKSNQLRDYYRGLLGRKIRPLAIALIRNSKGQFLLHRSRDQVKGEDFYRPLGGGLEFSETGQVALEREMMEELSEEVRIVGFHGVLENVFTFEGHKGHEIALVYWAEFKNQSNYEKLEMDIFESGCAISKAVWKSFAEVRAEGAKLYPEGLERVLSSS